MHLRTIKLLAVAAAAFVSLSSAAVASNATATADLNIRSGPGVHHQKIGSIAAGKTVRVDRCVASWCTIARGGWVSRNYLRPAFGFYFDGDGFAFYIGDGGGKPDQPKPKAQVCYFAGIDFKGKSFCDPVGKKRNQMPPKWDNEIASVRIPVGAMLRACSNKNLGGLCKTYTGNVSFVGASLLKGISSVETFYPQY